MANYHVVEIEGKGQVWTLGSYDELAPARALQDAVRARSDVNGGVFILNDEEFSRIKEDVQGAREYDIPHLDEGGIIAEVHEGEAVIPLDTPEGEEALADAVSDAVEEATADAIEETAEAIVHAEDIATDAIQSAAENVISDEIRRSIDQYLVELQMLSEPPAPEPEPEPVVIEEDTPPETSHWFFEPIRRRRGA